METTLVTLLGIAQDGGVPQAGCTKSCCMNEIGGPTRTRHPVALGITTPEGERHLVEASRTLSSQLILWSSLDGKPLNQVDSLWLTHAHLGHIDGLGQFGTEAWGPKGVPLHASESMVEMISNNPLLSPLFSNGHLTPKTYISEEKIELTDTLSITPIRVPHRDEHSDTHAFLIQSAQKRLLFLPDHDTWEETLNLHSADDPLSWFRSLFVDVVLLDGTFWSGDELDGNARKIGHPPVEETLELLGRRKPDDPRVVFFHFNHTNPLHEEASAETAKVRAMGWEVARQPMTFTLE
ncbi:MAG: MBL fold metallo-hydrolase [Candidatus Thalassarchaeaceae archaeon]|nr:MBL fold metallo-hydrolase [Candidatus Thalassarchaeaceae archaeon]MDP7042775.1 MBL fold metallo-hydrolase [Candidatus Thalassarchaeaceae archaeon]